METSHQICIIFMLIIIVAPSESGISPGISSITSIPIDPPKAEHNRVIGPEGCKFPSRYEGNWFQSGVTPTITISRNTINTKGRCLDSYGGVKYLIFNEKENCFRCVLLYEKHSNLLQYKESFCVPERTSLGNLCSTISTDSNLFTMFRLDAVPIDCPFKAPMTLTYNKGFGECNRPLSSVDSCIQSSRLLFNYESCPDISGTESTTEELQCLAHWKEGSYRYLVGLIKYRHVSSYEERFRCFVYEKVKKGSPAFLGSGNTIRSSPLTFNSSSSSSSSSSALDGSGSIMYRVSQSADPSCLGLSPTEGSRTMIFQQFSPQPKPCSFPNWLQINPRWHTLDQRTTFIFDSNTMKVVNSSSSSAGDLLVGNDPNSLTRTVAVCSQILENHSSDDFIIILHTTSVECRNGYVCTRIIRRDSHVIEIQMGMMARRQEDACHSTYFDSNNLQYLTLTSSNVKKKCPSLGHFGITNLLQEGRKVRDACLNTFGSFSVGCSHRETIEFQCSCDDNELISEYSCHGWFEENGVNYLITSPSKASIGSNKKYCFTYREMSIPLLESRTHQQKLSKSKSYLDEGISMFTNKGYENDGIEDVGRILQFSSFAESCRRDVAPGIEAFLAFNATSIGQCSSKSVGIISSSLFMLFTGFFFSLAAT